MATRLNRPVQYDSGPNYTQVSQCARAFLTEVLANHVLLPALDSIANPDSLNTVFLYLIDPIADDTDYPPDAPMVPLLNAYIDDWIKSTEEMPATNRMEALLQQPKQLANFVQYMKSINCSTTMTILLLMFEVVNKIETESLSPELCDRLKLPLHQLLFLLHCGRVLAGDELDHQTMTGRDLLPRTCSECGCDIPPANAPQLPTLLGLPEEITAAIAEAISASAVDPLSVARLVHTPEWTISYKTICRTMETLYLPAYLESPEFLGKAGSGLVSPSPSRSFFPTDEALLKSDAENAVGTNESVISRRFYKSPGHSNSFNNLNELNHRGVASTNPKAKDDMVTTTKNSSRLKFRRRVSVAPPTSESSAVELEDLDFSKWRVSIPFYAPTKASSRGNLMMNTLKPTLLNPSPSEQPDFSLFSFSSSCQGYFIIISEREVRDKKIISRVHRKFSEFYVLEQRLVEFHGSHISCRLRPRRPLGAHSHQFLENMKSYFERFLRYLLGQPFLRTSELMYTFLTASNVEFTSSNLPDIRLGRIVKSVPILLAKEKGQYTDEFLTVFRSSCFAQPVIAPSSQSALSTNGSSNDRVVRTPNSILDRRLRSKLYWNNAGISILQKHLQTSKYCAMEGSYVTCFYDLFGYLVDNFRKPTPKKASVEGSAPFTDPPPTPPPSDWIGTLSALNWLRHTASVCWTALKAYWYDMIDALRRNGWLPRSVRQDVSRSVTSSAVVDESPTGASLPSLLRRAIINVGLALRPTWFHALADLHLRSQVDQFLHLLVRNDYLAPMCLCSLDSIFFPAPPRSDREKAARREKVYAGLRKLTSRFHLQWFSEDDTFQRRLGRAVEVFQHGKWNKQLTYVLLDHILVALFPDVFTSPAKTNDDDDGDPPE
uniref:PX domain-containing protein n=1 Tax=Mesocestoides corti TaxID=53468 RepID=A0A5K3ESZ7_MESCO